MGRLTKDTQLRQIGWILRSTTLSIGWVHDPHYCTNTSVETITSIFLLKKSYILPLAHNSKQHQITQHTSNSCKWQDCLNLSAPFKLFFKTAQQHHSSSLTLTFALKRCCTNLSMSNICSAKHKLKHLWSHESSKLTQKTWSTYIQFIQHISQTTVPKARHVHR